MSKYRLALAALATVLLNVSWVPAQEQDSPQLRLSRAYLGIMITPSGKGADREGVQVRDVAPDSPASRAGLKKGDIITRVDNRQVTSPDELVNLLAQHRPGDKVTFQALRDNQEKILRATLDQPSSGSGQPGREGQRLRTGDASVREISAPFLGVMTIPTEELSQRWKQRLGLDNEQGLVVVEVIAESPAARAGLRHGDLITSLNQKPVTHQDELSDAIHRAGIGGELNMEVMRGQDEKTMDVRLE